MSHRIAFYRQLHRTSVGLDSPVLLPKPHWQQQQVAALSGDEYEGMGHFASPILSPPHAPLSCPFPTSLFLRLAAISFPKSRSPCSAVLAAPSGNTSLSCRSSHLSTHPNFCSNLPYSMTLASLHSQWLSGFIFLPPHSVTPLPCPTLVLWSPPV